MRLLIASTIICCCAAVGYSQENTEAPDDVTAEVIIADESDEVAVGTDSLNGEKPNGCGCGNKGGKGK